MGPWTESNIVERNLVASEIDMLDLDRSPTSWTVVGKIDMLDLDRGPTSWTVVGKIDMLDLDSLTGPFVAFFVTLPFESGGGSARGFRFHIEATFQEGKASLFD